MGTNVKEDELVIEILKEKREYKKIKKLLTHLDNLESIFVLVAKDESVAYINNVGCELLCSDYESLIGKNWFDSCFPKSIRTRLKANFSSLMAKEIELFNTCKNPLLSTEGNETMVNWDNSLIKSKKDNSVVASFSLGKVQKLSLVESFEHDLTDRETEILLYLSKGYNPKEVSKKLNIQPKTVHAHKLNLFNKMNFSSHRDLVSFAVKNGLLNLEDLIAD